MRSTVRGVIVMTLLGTGALSRDAVGQPIIAGDLELPSNIRLTPAVGDVVADMPEREYYAEQSRSLTDLITTAGVFIAVVMGAGATFAAVNTMYTAVASRTREIATLRAMGFGRTAMVCSVLAEAFALAFAGGVIGALAAWLLLDGYAVSTLTFSP